MLLDLIWAQKFFTDDNYTMESLSQLFGEFGIKPRLVSELCGELRNQE